MNDYCARIHARPIPTNPEYRSVGEAWILLYARTNTEQDAGKLMLQYLADEGWEVIEIAETGIVDITRSVEREALEKGLSEHRVFARVGGAPVADDRFFSQS
jgi:hypothetical protein